MTHNVQCQLCGISFCYEDYDMLLYHAWKYHPDVFESYRGDELRKIILVSKEGKVDEK